jgi:hypothetical protein
MLLQDCFHAGHAGMRSLAAVRQKCLKTSSMLVIG